MPLKRRLLWSRIFPETLPVEGLDVNKLARLNVTGGQIRNIAVHAAFYASEAGAPVTMQNLQSAARSELAKLGKPSSESELEDWA